MCVCVCAIECTFVYVCVHLCACVYERERDCGFVLESGVTGVCELFMWMLGSTFQFSDRAVSTLTTEPFFSPIFHSFFNIRNIFIFLFL